jgi:homocysteine S-methyltransferase
MPHVFPIYATLAWGAGTPTGDASPPHPAVEALEEAERFLTAAWRDHEAEHPTTKPAEALGIPPPPDGASLRAGSALPPADAHSVEDPIGTKPRASAVPPPAATPRFSLLARLGLPSFGGPSHTVPAPSLLFSRCGGRTLVLDGGLGTRLEDMGVRLPGGTLLWSARLLHTAPDTLRRAHADYVMAGADVITTASYQCSRDGLLRELCIQGAYADRLLARSVTLAREATRTALLAVDAKNRSARPAGGTGAARPAGLVAASVGPYGACVAGESEYGGGYGRRLGPAALASWHTWRVDVLLSAGPDVLAFETLPCVAEVQAVCMLLQSRPAARAWLSVSCRSETELRSGEKVTDAIDAVERFDTAGRVEAIGVNCVAPRHVTPLIRLLRSRSARPILVYPNAGEGYDQAAGEWVGDAAAVRGRRGPARFGEMAVEWASQGAAGVGGCCRVTPEHIAEARRRLGETGGGHRTGPVAAPDVGSRTTLV